MIVLLVILSQIVQSGYTVVDAGSGQVVNPADATVPVATELLTNTGFETGSLPPWYGNPQWEVVTTFPHAGIYCAADVGNNWVRQELSQPVLTDSIVSITIWSRQPDNEIQAIDFMYADATYHEDIVWPTLNWQQFDVTSWLSDQMGKTMVALRFWGYVGGGPAIDSTYSDDVSVIANVPLELTEGTSAPRPEFRVSPSVFRDCARITATDAARVSVYSATGALVGQLEVGSSGEATLQGQNLAPGAYVVVAEFATGSVSQVIQKR